MQEKIDFQSRQIWSNILTLFDSTSRVDKSVSPGFHYRIITAYFAKKNGKHGKNRGL
jgi:hypothetical protein